MAGFGVVEIALIVVLIVLAVAVVRSVVTKRSP